MQKYTQVGALAGCILGDGSIESKQLKIEHTNPQRNYVLWKVKWFEGLGLRVRKRMDYTKTTNLGIYRYSNLRVKMPTDELVGIHPADLVKKLDALGLLVWWLDDGSLSVHTKHNGSVSRFGYLNTQGYDKDSNESISEALYGHFGIRTTVHKDTGSGFKGKNAVYYRQYLNATNMRSLIDIVYAIIPHLPQDMLYKLDMQYKPNRLKDSQTWAERYNIVELFSTPKRVETERILSEQGCLF